MNLRACFILVSSNTECSSDSITSFATSSKFVSFRIYSHNSSKNVCFVRIFSMVVITDASECLASPIFLKNFVMTLLFADRMDFNSMVHGTINIVVVVF